MRILNNYDYEACNFIQHLFFCISNESASKFLLKAKGLSSRNKSNQTQSTKY